MMSKKCNIYLILLCISIFQSSFAHNRVTATITVGDSPAGLAATSDNNFVYVANNNNDSIPKGNTVDVISTANNTVIKTITDPSFNEPYTITINQAGTIAYVTNSNSSTITMIGIALNNNNNSVIGTINGFDGPSGMAITPDSNTAYVNNYGGPRVGSGNGTTVSVVNLNNNTIIDTITVGLAPAALAITPNGQFVYVINYVDGNPGTGTISVIQTSSNTVVKTIDGFSGPFNIAITPDGKHAYVTNFGSNNFSPVGSSVSVVDLTTNTISATIQLGAQGIQPSGIAITPNGKLAYVTIYNTLYLGPNFTDLTPGVGTVKIIDTSTNKVVGPTIVVGSSPANIVILQDGERAYVSNYSSNNVSVINIHDKMWLNVSN